MGVALLALGALVPQMVKLPLAAGQGLACVLLVEAGMAVKPLSGGLGAGTRWVLGLVFLATGTAAFALGALPLDLKVLHLGTPGVSVLASLAIVVGAVLLPVRLQGAPGAAATRLASVSLAVVLVHPLLILLLDRVSDLPAAVFTGAVVVASWLVALTLSLTPAASWLGTSPLARPRERRPA